MGGRDGDRGAGRDCGKGRTEAKLAAGGHAGPALVIAPARWFPLDPGGGVGQPTGTTGASAASADRSVFHLPGMSAGRSRSRTRRPEPREDVGQVRDGFAPTRRQEPRIVYAIAACSPPVSDPAKR
jgi:hypothetical protein